MNYRKTIDIVILKIIILTLLIFIFPINFIAAQEYDSFRFIVTADSRCDYYDHGRNTCTTNSFVNEVGFNRVLESIRNHDPAFVVFAGDMVLGGTTVQDQLNAWKGLMAPDFPLTKTMPAWGGHERDYYATNGVYTAWQNVFDPAGTDPLKYFDPEGDGANCHYPVETQYGSYGNTVYYCDYQNARFFVLNNDIDCSDGDPTVPSTCLEHQIGPNQLQWISDNSTGQELYFFGYHEAAYGTCAHGLVDISSGNLVTMDKVPDARNTFIELIDSFATMSFSGHEHQYSRRRINDSLYSEIGADPNSAIEGNFFEVKTGTCGAPIYGPYNFDRTGNNPDNYEAACMDNVEAYEAWPDKYYYSVIEVDNSGAQPVVYGTTYAVDADSGATEAVDFFAQPDQQVWKIGGPGEREGDWIYFGSNTTPPVDGSDRSWTHPEYVPGSGWLPGCTDDFESDYNNGLRSGIGYGDGDDCTAILGMRNTFSNVYARKTFNLDPAEVGENPLMTLAVNFDDEFEAFINEVLVGTWPREGGSVGQHEAGSSDINGGFNVPGGSVIIDWRRKRPPEQYPLDADIVRSALAGRTEHVLAIVGKNVNINSSDFSLAASLRVFTPPVPIGDELAMDFGALGLWDVDTAGAWRPISGGDVETMAGWANGLAMDFVGTAGVWNFDGTSWSPISGSDVETMVGWANGLAMDFGAASGGVWNVDTAGTWSPISGSDVETMSGWANGLAMDFGALGVWNVDTTGAWTPISGNVETMAAWANGLAMDFGTWGLWNVDTAGTWSPISGSDVETMSSWANGLAMDFGALGVWNVDTTGAWTPISGNVETMAGWANGLAMDFGAWGLWNVDTAWTWKKISGGDVEALTDVDLY